MPGNMKNEDCKKLYYTIFEQNSSSSFNCNWELVLCYGYKQSTYCVQLIVHWIVDQFNLKTEFLCLFRKYCIFHVTIYNIQVTSLWSSIQRLTTIVETKLLFSSFAWYFCFVVRGSVFVVKIKMFVEWFNYIWNLLRNTFTIRIMNIAHWTQATTLNECAVYNVHRLYDSAYCISHRRGNISARNSRWGFKVFHLRYCWNGDWGMKNEEWGMGNPKYIRITLYSHSVGNRLMMYLISFGS